MLTHRREECEVHGVMYLQCKCMHGPDNPRPVVKKPCRCRPLPPPDTTTFQEQL